MSQNFIKLKDKWPEIYSFAISAEKYLYTDPHSAAVKLRCFTESIIGVVYRELQLPLHENDDLYRKLNNEHFKRLVGRPTLDLFHAIRMIGNKAAHGDAFIQPEEALSLHQDAYHIGMWFCGSMEDCDSHAYPAYEQPQQETPKESTLASHNNELKEQLQSALDELSRLQESEKEASNKVEKLEQDLLEERVGSFRRKSLSIGAFDKFQSSISKMFINIKDSFVDYELTSQQSELVEKLDTFLNQNKKNVFLLKGYAGTGKTFITKGLTEYFNAIGRSYVLAAPTGKASKVISEKTGCEAYTIHKTIYSLNGFSEYREKIDGSETYKFYAELEVNDLSVDTVYIVDEASMVSDAYSEMEFLRFGSGYLLRDFMKFVNLDVNDHNKKIIFIGDNAQLPPIGMNFSPALNPDYLLEKYNARTDEFELTDVVRQVSDSGIMKNSLMLRNSINKKVFSELTIDYTNADVEKIEHTGFIDTYMKSCDSKINGESIVIAHSNADVAAYNRRIRGEFFPGNSSVSVGDKVMAVANHTKDGIFIANGDFGIVKKVSGEPVARKITLRNKNEHTGVVDKTTIELTFRKLTLGFRDLNGVPHFFETQVLENLLYSDLPSISSDESKALYVDFVMRYPDLRSNTLEFISTLKSDPYFNAMRLKFGYAITGHKSQGSEWNNCFVKCKTLQTQLSMDYFRWFYTAITRAKKKLYLLDPPDIKVGAGIQKVSSPSGPFNSKIEPLVDQEIEISNDLYGIPSDSVFSIELLNLVKARLAKRGVEIQSVSLNQYQDAYFVKYKNESLRLNISYNAKGVVTNVSPHTNQELSMSVCDYLSDLKGKKVFLHSDKDVVNMEFKEDFMKALYERIHPLMDSEGIKITNIENGEWKQRYFFSFNQQVAVFDIFYNGKKRFTKYSPIVPMTSDSSLASKIEALIMKGISQ